MTAPLRRRALLIGTEHHQDRRFDSLPSTRADTAQLAEVLRHRNIGAFEVMIRSDRRATEMREVIAAFFRERETDELALLYISGHGTRVPGGEFVFVAADTDADRLDETAVTAGFVNTCLEDCWSVQRSLSSTAAAAVGSPSGSGPVRRSRYAMSPCPELR